MRPSLVMLITALVPTAAITTVVTPAAVADR